MILSLWRYSHLALAISSFLFIALASITGIVLSMEPVLKEINSQTSAELEKLSLSEAIPTLNTKYDEILSFEIDAYDQVYLSAIDKNGDIQEGYIDPISVDIIGEKKETSAFFEFVTALHRSLFLKIPGRFFVGLTCFLLFLIAITGFILIIKRQQGIRHFLDKIIKDNFYQHAHTYLGRLFLIPVIIIALTGTYLSLERFELIPQMNHSETLLTSNEQYSEKRAIDQFSIFQQTNLKEVKSIEFPFSSDEEDYYRIYLENKEIAVHQYTGEVVETSFYPFTKVISTLSYDLHTGRGSVFWSIILGLSSASILFFIYSGFKLTLIRRKAKIRNPYAKEDCEYILLLGTETGSTSQFAVKFHQALLELGLKSYLTQLNNFSTFKKMKNLVVLTSTYGKGEAPINASNFFNKFDEIGVEQPFTFSVVGFGSLAYPDFCKYAFDVDEFLTKSAEAKRLLEIAPINNRSWEAFRHWSRLWAEKMQLTGLELPAENPLASRSKQTKAYKVIEKTSAEDNPDHTFMLKLAAPDNAFKSGDLIAIYNPTDVHERLYSISKLNKKEILLSVKKHSKGICSTYLNQAKLGDQVEGEVLKNKNFHLPKGQKPVMMISTGTGIAPFLGMIHQNQVQGRISLFWGGRTPTSLSLYEAYIQDFLDSRKLSAFTPVYSRMENTSKYVQHELEHQQDQIGRVLKAGGTIMICGSIAMQNEVLSLIERVAAEWFSKPLSYYQKRKQLLMDCY